MKSRISSRLYETAEASATAGYDRSGDAKEIDSGRVLQTLIRRYKQRKRPVSINFRRLLPSLNSADRFSHLIHPYPAKLLVHIPFFFLSNDLLSKPGDTVLDPFCGSGTVLFEAQLANRHAYGADANPLARLIARVKITPLDIAAAERTLNEILRRIPQSPSGGHPDVVNIDHWFYPGTTRQLRCLQEVIMKIRPRTIRDFFLVCFSVCVRKVSLADPRLSVPVRLFGQYPKDHPLRAKSDAHLRQLRRVRVAEIFRRISLAILHAWKNYGRTGHSIPPSAELICSDARKLVYEYSLNGKRNKAVPDVDLFQLVITSPPYPGAQKYIRSSSLSLGWLRLCLTSDLRACGGTNHRTGRAKQGGVLACPSYEHR